MLNRTQREIIWAIVWRAKDKDLLCYGSHHSISLVRARVHLTLLFAILAVTWFGSVTVYHCRCVLLSQMCCTCTNSQILVNQAKQPNKKYE